MKTKKLGYLFMATTIIGASLMFNSTAKAAESTPEMPQYYNADGEVIAPYTEEEYKERVDNILTSTQNNVDTDENVDINEVEMPVFYDAEGNKINPYTEDEYFEKVESILTTPQKNDGISIFSVAVPNYYDTFGEGSFRNFVWINQGKTYKNPIYVNVERENRSSGLAIYFYDSNDTYYGKAVFRDYGTLWHVATVDHLPRGKSYKFKLVSESGELAKVKHGNIAYDN